jgi:hypothetical protein
MGFLTPMLFSWCFPVLAVPRFGRCLGNFTRTIPWFSTVGLLLGVAGAATCYSGMADLQKSLGDWTSSKYSADLLTAFLWAVAFCDIVMFVVGIFSTGRCREWCCRVPPGRTKGKCSCRSCCRTFYSVTSMSTFILFTAIVIVACLVSMGALSILTVKVLIDDLCVQLPYLGPDFILNLSRCVAFHLRSSFTLAYWVY